MFISRDDTRNVFLMWVVCLASCFCFGQSESSPPRALPRCQEPLDLDSKKLPLILSAAQSGDSDAACLVGFAYHYGFGVKQSDEESAKWLLKSAAAGLPLAENELGYLYEHGGGVPQSDALAIKWYQAAADQGLATGQNNLGYMYYTGRGFENRNYAKAATLFAEAAHQGLADRKSVV